MGLHRETVLFLIHEALHAGGIQAEAAVWREIEEYAPLIPRRGEVTATVLIDGGCPERGRRLGRRLAHASHAISLRAGSRVVAAAPIPGTADPSSPVHYLSFPVGGLAATLDREEATLVLDDEDAQVEVSLPSEVFEEIFMFQQFPRSFLVPALLLSLAACGTDDIDPANPDSSDQPGEDSSQTPAECSATVPCVDEQIAALDLFATVAPGLITDEVAAEVHTSHVDAIAGGASPTQSFVYAKFTDGGLVKVEISDEQSFTSTDWDIAFRRYVVRTNSGVGGPACVKSAQVTGETFDAVVAAPTTTYKADAYMSEACQVVPDFNGIGSPATALGTFWMYDACVQMTGNVYVLELADDRHVKIEFLSYYSEAAQQTCNETGQVPMPSGSGNIVVRWAYLP